MYVHARNDEDSHIKTTILSRRYYYQRAKINSVIHRSNKWNATPPLNEVNASLSENHFKQACLMAFETAIINYKANFASIWQLKARAKKWSRQQLFLYGTKRSVIDRFLSKLKLNGYATPIMYYGSGTFPAGQRGERYAPCKWVKKKCKEFFETITINEFRTSQICPICLQRLCDVRTVLNNGERKIIRGLKWCNNNICSNCPIRSRDEVGTINIFIKSKDDYPICYDQPFVDDNGTDHGVRWEGDPDIHVLGVKNEFI